MSMITLSKLADCDLSVIFALCTSIASHLSYPLPLHLSLTLSAAPLPFSVGFALPHERSGNLTSCQYMQRALDPSEITSISSR